MGIRSYNTRIGESLAIYHCSVRTISRAGNHSAVAAAAYRSGQVLKDERTGQSHNYRNRKGILNALIFLPQTAPEEYADRLTLWNAAESAEVRKNSRVAREVILALPHELSESQRLSLSRDMALFLVEKYGVAVDLAVHAPQEDHGDDPRNHHAHLLFTTREITEEGLGAKTRILDDKEQGPVQIELIRQVWETLANDALQQAGLEGLRIDRRTLDDQGIDRIPQEHVGKAGTYADDDAEPPKKHDEEDEDGDSEQGKSGSGDSKSPASDKKPSSKDPAKKDKPQTRASINEEIKRLNELRAAFSPIPLKVQIKELDRLMDRLDGRVQRLKTLSDKTSLPERLTRAITSLYYRAKEFFAVRTKDEAARTFTAAEREAKAERQKARYGRTYRGSIQERMSEMRENIQILETKQKQHIRYEAFLQLIERRLETIRPTINSPSLPAKTEWKATASPQAINVKILNEAKQVREKIPVECRPTIKQEAVAKTFKAALASSASLVTINTSTKPSTAITRAQDFKLPEKHFTAAVVAPKDNNDRSVWHKEIKLQIKSIDQVRSERTPNPNKESMDSPKVWKVEANDKVKVIIERMQADIRGRKAEIHKPNDSNFSGRFNHPNKSATEDEVIQKVKTEAKAARAKVPPDMRAEPYTSEVPPKSNAGFSGAWKNATEPEEEKPKATMGSKFNSTAQGNASSPEEPSPGPKPQI